jgi:hypothetical protein
LPVDRFSGLLKNGFQLISELPVTGAPFRFNDLVGEAAKIIMRTVCDGTNYAF